MTSTWIHRDDRAGGRLVVAAVAVALLTAGVAVGPSASGAHPGGGVVVDPGLWAQVEHGPAPALLWWDTSRASRSEVGAYLQQQRIDAHVFERLPGALACSATVEDVRTMTAAPGAVSVWGDEPLEPALDGSVPTAFNGDPGDVWDGLGVTGEGVGIAVIDTGVDGTHPDLEYGPRTKLNVRVLFSHRETLGPNADPCVSDIYTEQMEDSEVTSGHGTHVTSVAAGDGTASDGRYRGVAPGADVVGVGVADTVTPQVGPEDGSGTEISMLGAVAGINYALANGMGVGDSPRVKVILAGWVQDGLYDPSHPMHWAIRTAEWLGVSVVFPVGNDGPEQSDCSAAGTCHFNTWAASPHAIAVAATPRQARDEVEPYSSRGDPEPRQAGGVEVRYEPTVAAPGTGVTAARRPGLAPYVQPPGSILGAGPSEGTAVDVDYAQLTGTSVAAAHTAGAIVLMQQAAADANGCYLTAGDVREILAATATPIPGHESWEAGAGALDVTAAVSAARLVDPPASPDPWMCPAGA